MEYIRIYDGHFSTAYLKTNMGIWLQHWLHTRRLVIMPLLTLAWLEVLQKVNYFRQGFGVLIYVGRLSLDLIHNLHISYFIK